LNHTVHILVEALLELLRVYKLRKTLHNNSFVLFVNWFFEWDYEEKSKPKRFTINAINVKTRTTRLFSIMFISRRYHGTNLLVTRQITAVWIEKHFSRFLKGIMSIVLLLALFRLSAVTED
jgi:hypothetical protein